MYLVREVAYDGHIIDTATHSYTSGGKPVTLKVCIVHLPPFHKLTTSKVTSEIGQDLDATATYTIIQE